MIQKIQRHILTKVPEVTIFFWIIKVLTTGMGETTSDFLVNRFNPIVIVLVAGVMLLLSLIIQFTIRKYTPWIYWFAVVMVSIFGTMAADILHIVIGIPYIVSALFFFVTLLIIFGVWYITEKTLSVHSINTFRRESFYWATILTTFALGTAVGDLTASTFHLGYLGSGILFAVLILIPALAYMLFRFNQVITFWIAYILTRPLGASFADWIGVSKARGGLNLGTGWISLILGIIILILVMYLSVTHEDVEHHHVA